MKARNAPAEKVKMLVAADLRRFIEDEPADGFVQWCEDTGEALARATSPEQKVYARLLRAMLVATIETANAAVKDGADEALVAVFVPRCAMTAAVTGLMSVMRDDTPTRTLRKAIIRELDATLAIMAPGKTLRGDTK